MDTLLVGIKMTFSLAGSTASIHLVVISGCDVPPCRLQRGTNVTVDVDMTNSEYQSSILLK